MRVTQTALNALACTLGIHSAAAAAMREQNWWRELQLSMPLWMNEYERGRRERSEERDKEKLKKIAALRSETSKKKPIVIDDGLMGRSAKSGKSSKSSKKFVDCMDGFTVEDPGVTCQEACDGECCEGDRSCDGFTGRMAKDGSCNHYEACRDATIGVVSGGSCDGVQACSGSEIDEVSGGSCKGPGACYEAEISVVSGGSCDGSGACAYSKIGVVSGGSCKGGSRPCYYAEIGVVSGQSCVEG